ncbi:MAG: T9SS type A sorting domain-containing protein [Bacteroidota bacterium]|nr:T9SS type A sorting domain-containing protein [Bacteroidota bacterium]MDQ6889134.1 T9SS type A sorting domain-containing protein [Bacteroidota bacterium]
MKNLYLILLGFFSFLIQIQNTNAQCTCSDGSAPDSLVYNQYFDSIIATNTVISFPQFDPANGTIKCIRLSDTVTTVVSYNLQNDLADSADYIFETFRRSQFTGPGGFLSSITSPPKDYGPYRLMKKDSVGDNIDVGPDTVFNKKYQSQYGPSNAAYYGTGNVNFNYLTTSTFTILTGSDNAIIKLRAYTRLYVQLVYYWCPLFILATHITDINASFKNNSILIQWQVNDFVPSDQYEIEMSEDGNTFTNAGTVSSSGSGSVAKYFYEYSVDKNFSGKMYYRIKMTGKDGKVVYSDVHHVDVNKGRIVNPTSNYSLFPNPSVTGIHIKFAENTDGKYDVRLINSLGQTIFQKKYNLNANNSINIDWPQKPAAGIYYLKVQDLKTMLEESSRLQVL